MNVRGLICVAVLGWGSRVSLTNADEVAIPLGSSALQSRMDIAMISSGPSLSGVPGITNVGLYSGLGFLLSDTVPASVEPNVLPVQIPEVTRKHGRIYLGRSIVRSGWRVVDMRQQAGADMRFLAERDRGSVPPPAPAPEPAD